MQIYPARKHVGKLFRKIEEILPTSEKQKPQVILLAGGSAGYRNDTDRELLFRQESNFYYISGCVIPGSFVLAHTSGSTSATMELQLFIPEADPDEVMWSGAPPTLEEAQRCHDATKISYSSTLSDAISMLVKALPDALFHTLPRHSTFFPDVADVYTQLVTTSETSACTDLYLLPSLHAARLIKDDYEVAALRNANAISSRAHEVVMRVLGLAVKGQIPRPKDSELRDRPLLPSEWLIEKEAEAEALFVASCRREGAPHQSYLPIVAAANRASTLHYCCNDKEFAWGPVGAHDHQNNGKLSRDAGKNLLPQVLLIDAGCEWNNYSADITRTMPVGNGGRFTKESRAIYSLVLEMQQLSFDLIKPGVHWDAVQLLCHKTLVRGFQRLGIFKSAQDHGSGSWNSEEAILQSGVSSAFFPHGVGHSLGEDVHDVPSASKPEKNNTLSADVHSMGHESFFQYLRLRLPLAVGMVVTVEPGIYFSPHLLAPIRDSKHINHDVLKRYEPVGGVRIEDDIVITESGFENLTTVRSDVDWIEGVCSGEL